MQRKPFVSKVNRKKRIDFAKGNEKQDRNFWNSVIFSDESKFNIHGSDGHQKVWRKENAALEPKNMRETVKHGGVWIMVWGCMAATGVGNLVIIDGIINQYSYLNILKNNLSPSASKLGLDFTFQQDNDPKHTARVVREWLLYNVQKQVNTPPQSPDHNPIEHLWDYLDRQIKKQEIKTKNDLKKPFWRSGRKIPSFVTQNLVKSVSLD
ncbi:transposable element Tc1 transposase [Trichonephila clavipes]|nr:transposable element Tc1 transposase [Trichonephila clavipes]